jgi:hypothetical protein
MLCRLPSCSVRLVPVASTTRPALHAIPPPVFTMHEPLMSVMRNPPGRLTPSDAGVPAAPWNAPLTV